MTPPVTDARVAGLPAGRERSILAACLLFLALWVVVAAGIALREPSLGWRFAPDPLGQGLLVYSPTKAIKVHDRKGAEERFVALRMPAAAGAPEQVLQLDRLIAVEAPSMLQNQEDLDRFFVLQEQTWKMLDAAMVSGRPLEMQTPDGRWQARAVHPRGWDELGWLFWVPLLCGVIPFVVGVGVGVFRWQSAGARYLALASVMALLALCEVSIVTGRLWLLAPWFAEAGQIFVRLTSLTAAWAFVMMVLHYPTPLRTSRAWARASGAWLLVLLVLNVLQWPDSQALRYKLWLVVFSGSLIVLAVWQSATRRDDPVHRAAARWLAASTLVAFSLAMYAFVVSLAYDVQVISNSYRWVSIPLLYIGLVFSVGRANLFELERWWVPLCLWYLGGTLMVLTDLGLVALLHVNSGAAITLALLLIGWLYFPLRQWVLRRIQLSSQPRVVTYVPDLISSINAGLAGPQAARQSWRQLLERVFEPLDARWLDAEPTLDGTGIPQATVADSGRQLLVPDVGARGVWQLTLAHRGSHLFTGEQAQVAGQLWRLLETGLSQQRQTQEAVDQERLRIASDLHDDLGAKLLTIAQSSAPGPAASLARQALDEMRLSLRDLAADAVPLADVLADWRSETVTRLAAAGFEANWEASDPPPGMPLPARAHGQLTRILREAISNAIRHSGGHLCRVRVVVSGQELTLNVQDDGHGLPQPGVSGRHGHGLPNIERRVRKLGGRHWFAAPEGGGTLLVVQVPLHERQVTT